MGLRRAAPTTDTYTEEPEEETRTRRVVAVEEPEDDEANYEPEDDNEVPANPGIIQSGWGEAKKRLASKATLSKDFQVTEEAQLVRFVTGKPFMFDQHWLKEREGKKSFICPGKAVCPLCKSLGDSPDLKYGFQVLNLSSEEDSPGAQWWIAGTRVFKQLDKFNDKAPIDGAYFAVSKTGKGGDTMFTIIPVKERDLEDDWEIDMASLSALLKTIKPLPESSLRMPTVAELKEIAAEFHHRS